jgi:hypothetical protein
MSFPALNPNPNHGELPLFADAFRKQLIIPLPVDQAREICQEPLAFRRTTAVAPGHSKWSFSRSALRESFTKTSQRAARLA